MPITQDRMIALIQDCARADNARKELIKALRATAKTFEQKSLGPEEVIALILDVVNSSHDPAMPAFWIERHHFEKVAQKNDRQRRYMDGQRRLQGVPVGNTAQVRGRTEVEKVPTITLSEDYWASLKEKQKEWEQEEGLSVEPPKAGESIF